MYQKLKLNDLDTTSIPHVVGASGESLGARGTTKCKININGKIFYQTFIVCEHLKRPIILGRDFSIQNCIGISWTKSNTHQLTQNNEVIAETAEYQTPSRLSVSLKKDIKKTQHANTAAGKIKPHMTNTSSCTSRRTSEIKQASRQHYIRKITPQTMTTATSQKDRIVFENSNIFTGI